MIEIIGGPDRDRTDDLFHAIRDNICGINDMLRNLRERKGHTESTALKKKCPSCALVFGKKSRGAGASL
jgi:hypothetical protein